MYDHTYHISKDYCLRRSIVVLTLFVLLWLPSLLNPLVYIDMLYETKYSEIKSIRLAKGPFRLSDSTMTISETHGPSRQNPHPGTPS